LYNNVRIWAAALLIVLWVACARSEAIPIFAQRYHLKCMTCHTAIPELNAFGQSFREHGYRLGSLPRHGTTVAAMRFQFEWQRDPSSADRRFEPAGVILADQDAGKINAFLHYSLGAQGGPGGVYLGYLTTYNEHTDALYRVGLFELPMNHSPGQRLDDLAAYGYDQTHVGLNDLNLAAPRWGLDAERTIGVVHTAFTLAAGEYQGAAYGGKPISTGEITIPARPEVGFFARVPVAPGLDLDSALLIGEREIQAAGSASFLDAYRRLGLGAHESLGRFDLLAQQWYGLDRDIDGVGDASGSSGGFARFKYYPVPHSYLGARYDSSASPQALRDWVLYAGTAVTPQTRVVLERKTTFGHAGATLEGALTVGFPAPF